MGQPSRRSGLMLPDEYGQYPAREFMRPDVKGRSDIVLTHAGLLEDVRQGVIGLDPLSVGDAQIDRVILGEYRQLDHFSWHRDDMLPAVANRAHAAVIGLNDDYEGGLLELPEAGLTLKVGRNVGVLFPAWMLHRVTRVTRGVRRVVLTFVLNNPTENRS